MLVWQGTQDTETILLILSGRAGDIFDISCADNEKIETDRLDNINRKNNNDNLAASFMVPGIKISLS